MVGHGGSSAASYLADPTSPIPSHCASIVATSTLRVKFIYSDLCMYVLITFESREIVLIYEIQFIDFLFIKDNKNLAQRKWLTENGKREEKRSIVGFYNTHKEMVYGTRIKVL